MLELGQALGELGRCASLVECCFERVDECKEVIGQRLDLKCASILVACGSSLWRRSHRKRFPALMNST